MFRALQISLITLLFTAFTCAAGSVRSDEVICGRWMSVDKDLVIQVSKDNTEYHAKILWFDDRDDSKELDDHLDRLNPDPALRSRKIVGMNVLEKLEYSPNTNTWENGVIYDAQHGRLWNSCAYITDKGELKVKGYWHFKFIGKTLTFKRI
ncbi:DUF2147 domain-containing protein [Mucilaginibacter conchicola]|uniref:DUF2147 domain-containing protein n=1 Tax=Mucilaginibacter conchicola TaxID=2303333 RepID=A0A372NYX1_9SPHI|nr:DUF2147 domain-containing protein [Mucilaginibacter conchicola]RFZ95094.1 DUF2147 domain-containing protein [Mucilaginibacter conchicola]